MVRLLPFYSFMPHIDFPTQPGATHTHTHPHPPTWPFGAGIRRCCTTPFAASAILQVHKLRYYLHKLRTVELRQGSPPPPLSFHADCRCAAAGRLWAWRFAAPWRRSGGPQRPNCCREIPRLVHKTQFLPLQPLYTIAFLTFPAWKADLVASIGMDTLLPSPIYDALLLRLPPSFPPLPTYSLMPYLLLRGFSDLEIALDANDVIYFATLRRQVYHGST